MYVLLYVSYLSKTNQELKFRNHLQDTKMHLSISHYFKIYDVFKDVNLGSSLQFSAYVLDLMYIIPSYDTHDSIVNCPFLSIIYSNIIFVPTSFFGILKPHIRALVAEKLTIEQKYPDRKYVNMANNYTENEYISYLLIIRSPQPNDENSLFLADVEYI